MPYLVNGQIVPDQVIREEMDRLSRDPSLKAVADAAEHARRLKNAAEMSAVDRVLIEQLAMSDPRGIDPENLKREIERLQAQSGCRSGYDDALVRQHVERELRGQRFRSELTAYAEKPTVEDVADFYRAHADKFHQPELFKAAHIVKYVNQKQNEEQAMAGIQEALAALETGEPFHEVADRLSDCADPGGDIKEFPAGAMAEEFEQALRFIEPGQRTGILRTGYGFHIGLLKDRTPAGQASLERMRPEIERVMTYAKRHEVYQAKVQELRSRAEIRHVPDRQAASG